VPPSSTPGSEKTDRAQLQKLLTAALGWLVLARWSSAAPRRSLRASLALGCLVVLTGLFLMRLDLTRDISYHTSGSGHALIALRMAFNWAHCGAYSRLSTSYDTALSAALQPPHDSDLPIAAAVVEAAGSIEEYCATVTMPFQNNENGTMIIMAGYMSLLPDLSMRSLGILWIWQTVPLLLVFCVALVATGQSLLFVLASFWIAISLIVAMAPSVLYSNYMLVPVFALALVGVLSLAVQYEIHRSAWRLLPLMLAVGAFVGFIAVLRTNYGLLCLLLVLAFLCFVSKELHPRRGVAATVVVLAALCLVAGQRTAIRLVDGPILAMDLTYNRVHHVIGHPLVLAVGWLQSPLAEREGIRWDDSVGLPLAQRIEPDATYLGPKYEKALLTYYAKLWIFHPGEMLEIYLAKWHVSVKGSLHTLHKAVGRFARALAAPDVMARDGVVWSFFALGAMAALWRWRSRLQPGAAIGAFLLLFVGWLLGVEQTILVPFTTLAYHALLAFVVCLVGMLIYQAVANLLVSTASTRWARRSGHAS